MDGITVEKLVKLYGMKEHPEGGYFLETYRAKGLVPKGVLPQGYHGDRSYSTGIYYLLPEGARSKLHRIPSDEMWHFYLGDPMTVAWILPGGGVQSVALGRDVLSGQRVQCVVPGGSWFGAYLDPGSRFSFVGCTVAPGFDFADFEVGVKSDLLKRYPDAKDLIERLTD